LNRQSDIFVVVTVGLCIGVSRASGVRAPWNGAVSEWRPFGMVTTVDEQYYSRLRDGITGWAKLSDTTVHFCL